MFDLAWSEIVLIAVVALVVIGPKDLPGAIRGLAQGIQKLRRMAGEFQSHVDEMVREAKLDEVRDQINQIRNFDLKGEIERAVDADGTIRRTFEEDPFRPGTAATYGPPASEPPAAPGEAPAGSIADTFGPPGAAAEPAGPPPPPPGPPAFIPPEVVRAAEAAKAAAPSATLPGAATREEPARSLAPPAPPPMPAAGLPPEPEAAPAPRAAGERQPQHHSSPI
jgi:sec-independent protein translocase protein TatB